MTFRNRAEVDAAVAALTSFGLVIRVERVGRVDSRRLGDTLMGLAQVPGVRLALIVDNDGEAGERPESQHLPS